MDADNLSTETRVLVEARDLRLTVPARPGAVNKRGAVDPGSAVNKGGGDSGLAILSGVSLAIRAGESVGLVGPSGSGKTSLLMLLAGLERPTAGQVTIDGTDLGAMDEEARARFRGRHIGIVFQSFHLIASMTALENVAVPLELAGRRDAMARAAEELEAVGLGHRLHHLPGQLSGGEQQRVALARAFAPRPRLLLADEPTGNLDQETGRRVIALMFGLQARYGTTLLLITHDAELAARCDRRLAMREGRLG